MYIVKAIVTAAEGKIWFESEVGKGTKFYVNMPLMGMRRKEGAKGLVESYS
jgi:signal transduction histidine kinase